MNNGINNANSTWSTDGRWFYFSREDEPGNFSIRAVDLHNANDTGTVVLRVPGSTVTQPMVASYESSEMLFFASNMPGGLGGMDIWWGNIVGAQLLDKKPLGPAVNTPGNETGPYFGRHGQHALLQLRFFAGHGRLRPLQEINNGEPGASINMGVPFNTPANDLYPAVNAKTMSGWFTSNRAGSFAEKGETCCNDLYRFSYPEDEAALARRRQLDTLPALPTGADTVALTDKEWKRITSLREKLPIRLYFHNDEPDPRSTATTTALDYAETYRSYAAQKPAYDSAWAATTAGTTAIDGFFTQQVDQGLRAAQRLHRIAQTSLGRRPEDHPASARIRQSVGQKRLQQEPLAAAHRHACPLLRAHGKRCIATLLERNSGEWWTAHHRSIAVRQQHRRCFGK